jgi:hypothetical protein
MYDFALYVPALLSFCEVAWWWLLWPKLVAFYIWWSQRSVHLIITIQKVTSSIQNALRQSPDIYWHAKLFSKTVFSIARSTFRLYSVMVIFKSSIVCMYVYIFIIHLVVCLTTSPKPLPKPVLHIVRPRPSSFKWEYPLLSLRSSNSFLRLLPCLLVTSNPSCIFPSVTRCRRQFLRKIWPIQLAFRLCISCRIFFCSLTLSNTLIHIYIYIYIYICFPLGNNSPASEFYMPTFRNTLSAPFS